MKTKSKYSNNSFFYSEKNNVWISVRDYIENKEEIIDALFSAGKELEPKITVKDNVRIIRPIGCGSFGCAYLTNNNKIVKLTTDEEEINFAYTVKYNFKEWPGIFVEPYALFRVPQDKTGNFCSVLWKDYALKMKKLEGDLLSIIFSNPPITAYSDRDRLENPVTKFDRKLIKFVEDSLYFKNKYDFSLKDRNIKNIGFSLDRERVVFFDYGMMRFKYMNNTPKERTLILL